MKLNEIKELSSKELQERIQAEKANYIRMKLDHTISPAENTSKLRVARKEIARMLTVLRQRQINEEK